MRGNEFLDKMELIDPAYIEAAENKPNKRKNVWVKWGAMAACICVLAAGALALPKWQNIPDAPVPMPNTPHRPDINVSSAVVGKEEQSEIILTYPTLLPVDEDYIMPIPTPGPVPENPQYSFVFDGAFETNGASEVGEVYVVRNMISGYGELKPKTDMAVNDGGVYIADSLEEAMEHYGDSVRYRVFIDLYSDGVNISSGSEQAIEEAQRLVDLGYIVAIETYTQTEDHGEYVTATSTYYFTLHAEYEQLKNFTADENLGYHIMFYDEGVGISSSSYGVVFSGSAVVDK